MGSSSIRSTYLAAGFQTFNGLAPASKTQHPPHRCLMAIGELVVPEQAKCRQAFPWPSCTPAMLWLQAKSLLWRSWT